MSRLPNLVRALVLSGLVARSLAPLPCVAEPPAEQPSEPGALDAELLRQVEQAARLDREFRARQSARVEAERVAEQTAHEAEERAVTERERANAIPYESAILEQQGLQGDLIWQATGRGAPREPGEGGPLTAPVEPGLDHTDPRIAAPAPVDRELPMEIFDREEVDVPSGHFGNDLPIRAVKLVLDADGDGKPELIRWLRADTEVMIRQEEDRNYDGVLDAISLYTNEGAYASRVLDANDDGNPDVFERYRDGRLAARDIDRDDDGVRDVFYRYDGDSIADERHDADNDGVIDLVIIYQNRLRVRTEEDLDRDGRMDVWTTYSEQAGLEQVARIERDRKGRGHPDTFEIFETRDGKTVLLRLEQDTNGDGEIDVVSFYVGGKLRRRQIRDPNVSAM